MTADGNHWKQLNDRTDDDLSGLINLARIAKLQSQNPLAKIKRNLLLSLFLGVLICGAYVAIFSYAEYWQVKASLGIVSAFSIWALGTAFQHYRQIPPQLFSSGSLLGELIRQHQSLTNWLHAQSQLALFIYPVSAAGGFMMGGAAGSGKPVSVLMSQPLIWLAMLVVIAILVPVCHQLTKWLTRRSFGRYLDDLQQHIDELAAEN